MTEDNERSRVPPAYTDIGILFISPIIGLPPSLVSAFEVFKDKGIEVQGVDIFDGQKTKKNMWNVLSLTALPGSQKRRIAFANHFDEKRIFSVLTDKVDYLKTSGKRKIIIGGMSGGFIFAARLAQNPPDSEAAPYAAKIQSCIKGLFGISPLIFYPSGVVRIPTDLERIPVSLPTRLIWGDADTIVPAGTIEYAKRVSNQYPHIHCRVIRGSEVSKKDRTVRHQFFGGRDFSGPLTNIYWNALAERIAQQEISKIIDMVT